MKPSAVASSPSWLKSSPVAARCWAARGIGGRVLHARDVLEVEQALHRIDRHVDHGPRWNIVDDDRDADGVVDRPKVLVEPFLRRLVVIRRHDQDRVGAGVLRVAGERNGLLGGVRARTRDHRHATFRLFDTPFDDLAVLLVSASDSRRSSRRGRGHSCPRRSAGLESAKSLLVDRTVAEGGDERGERAPEARLGSHDTIL